VIRKRYEGPVERSLVPIRDAAQDARAERKIATEPLLMDARWVTG